MQPYESIVVVTAVCLSLATVSVALRIWVRWQFVSNGLQADDWTILAAALFFAGFCVVAFVLAGKEAASPVFSAETGEGVISTLLVGEVVFQATCLLFKLSLTIFFLKFLVDSWQRYLTLAAGFFYCSTCVVGIILALFQCGLPIHLMHKHLTHQCVKLQAFTALLYVHGIMSALTDWVFALLPTITIYRSDLSRAAKISSSCLLLLACGGSIAAIARTATTGNYLLRPSYFDPNRRPNYYAVSAPMINLTIIELGLGITAVSLACLRPLVRRVGHVSKSLTSRLIGSDMSKSGATDEEATLNLVVVNTKQDFGPTPTGPSWNETPRLRGATSPGPDAPSWNETPRLAVVDDEVPHGSSWNQTPRLGDATSPPPDKPSFNETPRLAAVVKDDVTLGSSFNQTPRLGASTGQEPNKPSWNETPRLATLLDEDIPSESSFNQTPRLGGSTSPSPPKKSLWKRTQRLK